MANKTRLAKFRQAEADALDAETTADDRDFDRMLDLTRQAADWHYSQETRDNAVFLPAAYNSAYYEGRKGTDRLHAETGAPSKVSY